MCSKENCIHCFILCFSDLISHFHFSLSSVSSHFILQNGTLCVSYHISASGHFKTNLYQDLSYVLHYLGYMGSSCCLLENGGETLIWWKTIPWQISTCWAEGGLWDGPCSCSQGPQWHRVDGGCSRWAWGRTVFMLLWSWVAFGLGGNRLLPIAAAQATCLGEHLLPRMC